MKLIVYAIPVFFILIGIELLIARMRNLSYYRFNDAVTNLSCGIGSQISGIFLKTFTFIGYTYLYQHSIWKIQDTVLTGILLFIGVDFFYYWFHRLAHEISFLWGSHVVHHQSEEYNLTVALRQAALQGAFSWVFYLPLAVVGFSPAMFLTIASLQTLYQFWIHTKLINKMHPAFEYVFNTPSHHRVHHGVNPKYIDRNHGGTLIIFDRMFGTFQVEEEEVVYGITKQPKSWNPVYVNFEYWIDLFKETFSVRSHADKVRMMLKGPGWKPAELGGVEPMKDVSYATFTKYDTDIPGALNYYVLAQFILVLAGTTIFLNTEMKEPFSGNILLKVGTALVIILSLVNIGGIFERKAWVPVLEYVRLVATAAVVMLLVKASPNFYAISGTVAAIALASAVWFTMFLPLFKTTNTHAEVYAG
jgi:sterol desaturase/sphingolipid hydroxylase (fatty acid hydroxylase superfamily)